MAVIEVHFCQKNKMQRSNPLQLITMKGLAEKPIPVHRPSVTLWRTSISISSCEIRDHVAWYSQSSFKQDGGNLKVVGEQPSLDVVAFSISATETSISFTNNLNHW